MNERTYTAAEIRKYLDGKLYGNPAGKPVPWNVALKDAIGNLTDGEKGIAAVTDRWLEHEKKGGGK